MNLAAIGSLGLLKNEGDIDELLGIALKNRSSSVRCEALDRLKLLSDNSRVAFYLEQAIDTKMQKYALKALELLDLIEDRELIVRILQKGSEHDLAEIKGEARRIIFEYRKKDPLYQERFGHLKIRIPFSNEELGLDPWL